MCKPRMVLFKVNKYVHACLQALKPTHISLGEFKRFYIYVFNDRLPYCALVFNWEKLGSSQDSLYDQPHFPFYMMWQSRKRYNNAIIKCHPISRGAWEGGREDRTEKPSKKAKPMCPKSQCCLPAPILLSCLKLSWLAFPFSRLSFSVRMCVEVEHKQIFHFMPLKLTLSYIKEYNVDLKVFGASPKMNAGYSIVYFSNLRVGIPSFHCCFRLCGSQGSSLASLMVSGTCLEHQLLLCLW